MPTAYQIYAMVLADRIGEVLERKGLILANLAGGTERGREWVRWTMCISSTTW